MIIKQENIGNNTYYYFIHNYSDYPLCNQIDYLNFHCNVCNKNLCKKHYHNDISCPFAQNKEEIKNKKDFNYQINYCDFCKGEIKNMDPIKCDFCKKLFCLKHKLESDHDCPSLKKLSIEEIHKRNKELVKQRMAELKKKKGIK